MNVGLCIFKANSYFAQSGLIGALLGQKIQNFHKICLLDFSEMLFGDRHSKGTNRDFL